jgi:hypothetical protein
MQKIKLMVNGNNLEDLINLIERDLPIESICLKPTKSVYIYMYEEFYFRISSHLMITAVYNFISNDRCVIDIISGGAKQGWAGIDWGAESSSNKYVCNQLKELCEENGWMCNEIEE